MLEERFTNAPGLIHFGTTAGIVRLQLPDVGYRSGVAPLLLLLDMSGTWTGKSWPAPVDPAGGGEPQCCT